VIEPPNFLTHSFISVAYSTRSLSFAKVTFHVFLGERVTEQKRYMFFVCRTEFSMSHAT